MNCLKKIILKCTNKELFMGCRISIVVCLIIFTSFEFIYYPCVYKYVCYMFFSGATKGCAWRMGRVQRVWTVAGGCGHPGRNAAGPVEVESHPLSDTATVPGTDLNYMRGQSEMHQFCSVKLHLADSPVQ